MNDQIIDALHYRYATKNFDTAMPVKQEDLDTILESLRLSPSSFGLEGWGFVLVNDKSKREQLLNAAYGQKQVVDASHLLVLCRSTDSITNIIDKSLSLTASTRNIPLEYFDSYKDMMMGSLANRSEDQLISHLENQVYIAAGFAMETCALLGIDACPMEGFDKNQFDEILGLGQLGLASAIVMPIGYRSIDDKYATMTKVRKDKSQVIHII